MEYLADQRLSDHADLIMQRLNETSLVQRIKVSPNDWSPQINECHRNVDRWVAENSDLKSVRGWLVFDFRPAICRLVVPRPKLDFLAHSLVEKPDGELIDITPAWRETADTYPFIRHTGRNAEFEEIIAQYNLARLSVYFDTDPKQVTFQNQ